MENKVPSAIRVTWKKIYTNGEFRPEVEHSNLDDVLRNFFIKLGYTNENMRTVTGALLTAGKIRIEFPSHIERFELLTLDDLMCQEQAEKLVTDFIESMSGESMTISLDYQRPQYNVTQQISLVKRFSFDQLKIGDVVKGIHQNLPIPNIRITSLNRPMVGIHTGQTGDGKTCLIYKGNGAPTPFFQVSFEKA